jgi:hypothetical protein
MEIQEIQLTIHDVCRLLTDNIYFADCVEKQYLHCKNKEAAYEKIEEFIKIYTGKSRFSSYDSYRNTLYQLRKAAKAQHSKNIHHSFNK